jgi:hypothetical protein
MSVDTLTRPKRLAEVFEGFPRELVSGQAFDGLTRFGTELDVLGRIDCDGEPFVDEETLRATLRLFVDPAVASRLVDNLGALPASALRTGFRHPVPAEMPWFGLAERVTIFDESPGTTFADLRISKRADHDGVVYAVQAVFPSLEPELLEARGMPTRIEALLDNDEVFATLLRTLVRQLGWWAALVAVLLVPPAAVARAVSDPCPAALRANAWPLAMHLLAAALGGWTLTVVGSCILAPLDAW